MTEQDYKARYGATHEQWMAYNRKKQKEYRDRERHAPARKYLKTSEIFRSEGHCNQCGMRLDAEFHKKFPCKT